MKCLLCNKAVCGCEKEVVLPTKSTLSSSVTEFPDPFKQRTDILRSRIPVRIHDGPERSSELVPQKLSFDSRMDLFNNASTSGRLKPMQTSHSLRMPKEKYQPKPFPAFEDYTKKVQHKIPNCAMCSKVLLGQPSEQSFAQQVRAAKHLNGSLSINRNKTETFAQRKHRRNIERHFLASRERKVSAVDFSVEFLMRSSRVQNFRARVFLLCFLI